MSISGSVSPVGKVEFSNTVALEDRIPDTDAVALRYGCGRARPAWLQWLNNIVGVVTLFCAANFMLNFTNGLVGVVLSTIERRFDLTSSQSSWIAAGYEFGPIPILILISIFGNRIHRPVALSIGLISMSIGCTLFFIPQFIAPPYRPDQQDLAWVDGLCSSNRSSTCDVNKEAESLSYFLPVFIVARFLTGMGGVSIYTIGLNHMDDCSSKEKFAKFCGIFMAMAVIGPAIAFLLGALTLEIFTDFYLISSSEIGIDSNDSRWIGCWWISYIVAAGLCFINAIPIWGYRRDLPGAANIRAKKITEAHKDDHGASVPSSTDNRLSYAKSCAELGTLAKSVLSNPTYLSLTLFAICDNFIMAGFTAFGPKYFEFGFAMSPTLAGIIFGVVLIPAGAGGTIIGGFVIEKMRLSCKQIMKIQTCLAGLVAVGCFLLLLVCDSSNFAGINTPYNVSSVPEYMKPDLIDTCNANCFCNGVLYQPICSHDQVQYFSPCHAGCTSRNETSGSGYDFYNCSCIGTLPTETSLPIATSGSCSSGICTEAIVFLILFFFAVFAIFACMTTNTASTLRCVTSSQTAFALGVQVLLVKLIGTIPGPLMMGLVFDRTCLLWQTLPCSEDSGSCAFYDNSALSRNFTILMATVKLISFAAMLLAVALYRPPRINAVRVNEKEAVASTDAHEQFEMANGGTDVKTNVHGTSGVCNIKRVPEITVKVSFNGAFVSDDGDKGVSEMSHL